MSSDCASQSASGRGRRRSTAASLLYFPAVPVWVGQARGSPRRRSSHPDSLLSGLPGSPGTLAHEVTRSKGSRLEASVERVAAAVRSMLRRAQLGAGGRRPWTAWPSTRQSAGLLTTMLAARRTDPSPHQVTGTPERTWAFFTDQPIQHADPPMHPIASCRFGSGRPVVLVGGALSTAKAVGTGLRPSLVSSRSRRLRSTTTGSSRRCRRRTPRCCESTCRRQSSARRCR